MKNISTIRSQILEENQKLMEKLNKVQFSFESKLQKSIQNLIEIEIPQIKAKHNEELNEIFKKHEKSIDFLMVKLSDKRKPKENPNFFLKKSSFSSGNEDRNTTNINEFKAKSQKNKAFAEISKGINHSSKESLNFSHKNSMKSSINKLEKTHKPSFYDWKNPLRPDFNPLKSNQEFELRKRLENFAINSSSSSSIDSSFEEKTKDLKKKEKKLKKKSQEKLTKNSILDSSSD